MSIFILFADRTLVHFSVQRWSTRGCPLLLFWKVFVFFLEHLQLLHFASASSFVLLNFTPILLSNFRNFTRFWDFLYQICPGLIRGCIRIFLVLFFLWKFLFWTLSIFKRGPDIRIFPTLSNFKNVNFIYTNFPRVQLDFIYPNAGWALFHANRSLFSIIWWN